MRDESDIGLDYFFFFIRSRDTFGFFRSSSDRVFSSKSSAIFIILLSYVIIKIIFFFFHSQMIFVDLGCESENCQRTRDSRLDFGSYC